MIVGSTDPRPGPTGTALPNGVHGVCRLARFGARRRAVILRLLLLLSDHRYERHLRHGLEDRATPPAGDPVARVDSSGQGDGGHHDPADWTLMGASGPLKRSALERVGA